jgi:hypothetical protein
VSAVEAIAEEYAEVMEALRLEHMKHDVLEAKAQRASRTSFASYEKLVDLRDRGRQLRSAYGSLTGEDLDGEIAKLEDKGHVRAIEVAEKKEGRLRFRQRWSERPKWARKGSLERERA